MADFMDVSPDIPDEEDSHWYADHDDDWTAAAYDEAATEAQERADAARLGVEASMLAHGTPTVSIASAVLLMVAVVRIIAIPLLLQRRGSMTHPDSLLLPPPLEMWHIKHV